MNISINHNTPYADIVAMACAADTEMMFDHVVDGAAACSDTGRYHPRYSEIVAMVAANRAAWRAGEVRGELVATGRVVEAEVAPIDTAPEVEAPAPVDAPPAPYVYFDESATFDAGRFWAICRAATGYVSREQRAHNNYRALFC